MWRRLCKHQLCVSDTIPPDSLPTCWDAYSIEEPELGDPDRSDAYFGLGGSTEVFQPPESTQGLSFYGESDQVRTLPTGEFHFQQVEIRILNDDTISNEDWMPFHNQSTGRGQELSPPSVICLSSESDLQIQFKGSGQESYTLSPGMGGFPIPDTDIVQELAAQMATLEQEAIQYDWEERQQIAVYDSKLRWIVKVVPVWMR